MACRWSLRGASRRDGLVRRQSLKRSPDLLESRGGQAMVEYLVMTGIFLASLAVLALFLVTFKEYGYRILDMVSSDYP